MGIHDIHKGFRIYLHDRIGKMFLLILAAYGIKHFLDFMGITALPGKPGDGMAQ